MHPCFPATLGMFNCLNDTFSSMLYFCELKGYSTPKIFYFYFSLTPVSFQTCKRFVSLQNTIKIFWIKTGRLVTVPLTAK